MVVNPFTDRIEIMDVRLRKILSYTLDGEFIQEWRIEDQLMDFAPLTKEKYVFHWDGREFEPGEKHPLLSISNPTNTESYLGGLLEYGITDYYRIINKFSFTDFGRLLYMHPMHDTIYEVQEGLIKPAYFVNFKEKRVPHQIKTYDMMGFHQAYLAKDYYAVNGNLFASSEWIAFLWLRKERGWENKGDDVDADIFLNFYNNTTGNSISVPITSEDALTNANFPIMVSEEFFFSVHYPGMNNESFSQESNPEIIKFKIKPFSED